MFHLMFCRGLLGVSPTLVNLVEDHGFISEEYYLHWYEVFWGTSKQSRERLCSRVEEYYLHWYKAFWGNPKKSHERLCSKWIISYHCGESDS